MISPGPLNVRLIRLTMSRPPVFYDVESNGHEQSNFWRDWTTILTWSLLGYLCIIITVIGYLNPLLLPLGLANIIFNKDISPFFAFSQSSGRFSKPHDFKIVALVPFINHERTAILDCYLQVSPFIDTYLKLSD